MQKPVIRIVKGRDPGNKFQYGDFTIFSNTEEVDGISGLFWI